MSLLRSCRGEGVVFLQRSCRGEEVLFLLRT